MDGFKKNPVPEYVPEQWIIDEVYKVSHRSYIPGFYFGRPEESQNYENGGYIRGWDIVAVAQECSGNTLTVLQRNRFFEGDELEVLEPGKPPFTVTVKGLCTQEGEPVTSAPNPMRLFKFEISHPITVGAILRKNKI